MSVSNLKLDLATLLDRGKAGCVTGIIVSEYMWNKLEADFDGEFKGRMGVSGVCGNRRIRYEFFVLKSPAFPKDKFPGGYFFVPFSEEDYRARILGHENDETLVPRSSKIRGYDIKELDPVTGESWVYDRQIGPADFCRLVTALEVGTAAGRTIPEQAGHFWYSGFTFRKPDKVIWLHHPERYDYRRADLSKSVGRLLMRRTEEGEEIFFDIVGIAINGKKQIIHLLSPKMRFTDAHEFAQRARYYFLPEEIVDFLNRFGITIDPKELRLDPLYEPWRHDVDLEDIGRLKQYVSSSKGNAVWDLHSMSATFIGSRAVGYSFDLCSQMQGTEWEKIEAEHFPENWGGWPDTNQFKALKSFAQAWAGR